MPRAAPDANALEYLGRAPSLDFSVVQQSDRIADRMLAFAKLPGVAQLWPVKAARRHSGCWTGSVTEINIAV